MFEWGVNMFIGQYLHHLLLLHAAVVERDGRALVLPALPGSGKSTLCAALATSGWRLLSDEFGAFDLEAGVFRAMLKPVALKNRSIDVIRAHAPDAVLGPVFAKTRKGDVAHLAPSRDAVDRRHDPVPPGAIVLPRWVDGAELQLRPLSTEATFRSLAFNAFNYQTIGAAAFNAVVSLTRVVPAWQLAYGRLDDALVALDRLWQRDVGPIPGAR
jgi:HprK-related kinase A